jgi:hypothetical protein
LGSGGGGGTREDNILSNNLGFRSERRTASCCVYVEGSRLESGEDGGIDDGGIDDGSIVDGGILTAGSNRDGRLEKRLYTLVRSEHVSKKATNRSKHDGTATAPRRQRAKTP